MGLYIAALLLLEFQQPPLGRAESLAHSQAGIIGVSVFLPDVMPVLRNDDALPRHHHFDVNLEAVAGLMATVEQFHRNAATYEMRIEPVELGHPFADVSLERWRGRKIVKDDFDWTVHRITPICRFGFCPSEPA